jgi:hypothetical protein
LSFALTFDGTKIDIRKELSVARCGGRVDNREVRGDLPMPMTALPVTVGDVQNIQIGVGTFSDAAAATSTANAITAGTTSLNAFAQGIVASAFGVKSAGNWTPVTIAVDSIVLGGVPPAGALGAANTLANLSNGFDPQQAGLATKLGLSNPTEYVTEQLAQTLAQGGDTNLKTSDFLKTWNVPATGTLTDAQIQTIAQTVQTQTGINTTFTTTNIKFWTDFYTKNPITQFAGVSNLTPTQAGVAAGIGDSIGEAMSTSGFAGGTVLNQSVVFNALVDNAEQLGGVKNADGSLVTYKVGVPMNAQQPAVPLQGANVANVVLEGLSKFVVPPDGIPPVAGTPLDPLAAGTATPNVITDNALANLTVNNTDGKGATLAITKTPTVTTLNLSLNNNGVDAAGNGLVPLWIVDTNNEITTLTLSLGAQNSFLVFQDNGLKTITSSSGGGSLAFTGANPFEGGVPSTFFDNNKTAVNFDFSGINGPSRIAADRSGSGNQADVYTLGNFGSDLNTAGKFQVFTFVHQNAFSAPGVPAPLNADQNNTATINFGSGAYFINDALHNAGINNVHNYVNTAANGTALGTLNTAAPYALIESAFNGGDIVLNGGSVIQTGDTLQFKQDNVSTVNATNLGGAGGAASVEAGVATALATLGAHQAGFFTVAATAPFGGGDTFVFDHADASLTLTAADALVGFAGLHPTLLIGAPSTDHVIPLTA